MGTRVHHKSTHKLDASVCIQHPPLDWEYPVYPLEQDDIEKLLLPDKARARLSSAVCQLLSDRQAPPEELVQDCDILAMRVCRPLGLVEDSEYRWADCVERRAGRLHWNGVEAWWTVDSRSDSRSLTDQQVGALQSNKHHIPRQASNDMAYTFYTCGSR